MRIILHIDMNSYFASCEQQDNPQWRGLPLGVCEHLGGIIIAPSIEAKRYGIKTGTPIWEARKLYPKIVLTKTHPERYRHYTRKFLQVLADYTDHIEKYSIDEAFLDVTRVCSAQGRSLDAKDRPTDGFDEARRMAIEIKHRITREVGDWLQCSVGIGWNKLIAKIGSDMQKPNGLTVLRPADKPMLYQRLQLTDIPGIAHRMEFQLNRLGIKTLADLRDYPKDRLVAKFGIGGHHLWHMGQLEGSWKEGFIAHDPIKSMGHMYTVSKEWRDKPIIKPLLYKLSEMVAARLRANELMGQVVAITITTAAYDWYGKSRRLNHWIQDGRDIYLESIAIINGLFGKKKPWPGIKLLGVTVAALAPYENHQSLFPLDRKHTGIARALDTINDKYGDFTVARVPAFQARHIIRDSIGFGRMKEFKVHARFSGRG
jgi:DNA polymerase IV